MLASRTPGETPRHSRESGVCEGPEGHLWDPTFAARHTHPHSGTAPRGIHITARQAQVWLHLAPYRANPTGARSTGPAGHGFLHPDSKGRCAQPGGPGRDPPGQQHLWELQAPGSKLCVPCKAGGQGSRWAWWLRRPWSQGLAPATILRGNVRSEPASVSALSSSFFKTSHSGGRAARGLGCPPSPGTPRRYPEGERSLQLFLGFALGACDPFLLPFLPWGMGT